MYTSWVAPITCTRDRQYVILHCRQDPEMPWSSDHYSLCQQNHRTGFWTQIAVCATLAHAQNWAHDDYCRYGYKRKNRRGPT
jgi:hypothetical protein